MASVSDWRLFAASAEEINTIEAVGQDLLRHGDAERGLVLLALCLKWRSVGREIAPPESSDSDEAAELAEVIELHGWSRRADQ